ncbi:hypothetical protein T484DRAFT_1774578 [Baffinella frigidus]|nr:hypothetical protein T484DRAFT_1774578 [Cryptophyta sp. CCMP2293]
MELKVRRMQSLVQTGRTARDKRGISLRTPIRSSMCEETGRTARDKRGISLRTPIRSCTVMCPNKELTDDIEELKNYVLEELNVRSLTCTQEEGDMVVRSAAPDNTILGRRLGKAFREVSPPSPHK